MQEAQLPKSNLYTLFLSILLVGMGFSIIIPVLPFYAKNMGASAFQLGLLMTVYALCQFIFSPIWGRYSDRVGRRPVLLAGLLGFAFTFFCFAFATHLWMLYVIRIAGGIFSCATLPTAMAVVGDSTSVDKRASHMGLMGASMGMGMIMGPAIGGMLSHYSLSLPFLFAGLLCFLNFVAVFIWVKESHTRRGEANPGIKTASLISSLKTPLAAYFIIMLLISIADASHQGTFALYVKDRANFNSVQTGWAFTLAGLGTVLAQGLILGRMTNRVGEERTAKTGILVMGASFALFLYADNFLKVMACMGIYALGVGLIRPALNSRISKQATDSQGSTLGILQSYDSLGRVIGPSIGGWLLDINLAYAYVFATVFALLGMVVISAFMKRSQEEGTPSESF
ncbi:MAG: MFS transporter [Syntrophomonadaceae bacterium]